MKRTKKEETFDTQEEGPRPVEPKELEQVSGGYRRYTYRRSDYDYGDRSLG